VEIVTETNKASLTSDELVALAAETLVAHKGQEPMILEVKGLCSFSDYFVICSGGSRRHVLALAQHLQEALKQAGVKPLGMEGLEDGNWVLLDYNDVVIHLFVKALREFYDLEGLWVEATRLPAEDFSRSQAQRQTRT
jgi:ribosome-associated protein